MSIDDKKQCLGWFWTALVVFTSLSIIFYFCFQKLNMTLGLCIIILLAFSAIIIFIKIFTDIIPFGRNDCEEAQNLIRRWMIYAYAFMVFSLAISILPFMTKIDSIFNQTGRPVSLVNGCIESTDTANQLLLCKPEKTAAKTEKDNFQWLLSIGGNIESANGINDACSLSMKSASNDEKQQAIINDFQEEIKSTHKECKILITHLTNEPKKWTITGFNERVMFKSLNISFDDSNSGLLKELNKNPADKSKIFALITSKLGLTSITAKRYKIKGGLVVPLYVIILAMIGGAISLTRRIPEIQMRASVNYVLTEKMRRLTPQEAREHLIFQIVQFISAPYLAVLAFYLIETSSVRTTVILAFSAGFASESILLMIRELLNKISPVNTEEEKYGSVSGVVCNKQPNNKRGLENVDVKVSTRPGLQIQTDEYGHYIIESVPVGECVIEASNNIKNSINKVTIEQGKTVSCNLQL